jgi:GntR family transcriptional regulator/MocR family aminotransferase
VVPSRFLDPIATGRRATDHATSSLLQAACATFLASGDLDRHLRRTRRVYRQRRDALIAALARWLPEAIPSGIAAGLHLLVTLPRGPDEAEVTERARAAGVVVYPLRTYRTSHPPDRPPALVLGYGTLSPAQMDQGVRLLAEASHP